MGFVTIVTLFGLSGLWSFQSAKGVRSKEAQIRRWTAQNQRRNQRNAETEILSDFNTLPEEQKAVLENFFQKSVENSKLYQVHDGTGVAEFAQPGFKSIEQATVSGDSFTSCLRKWAEKLEPTMAQIQDYPTENEQIKISQAINEIIPKLNKEVCQILAQPCTPLRTDHQINYHLVRCVGRYVDVPDLDWLDVIEGGCPIGLTEGDIPSSHGLFPKFSPKIKADEPLNLVFDGYAGKGLEEHAQELKSMFAEELQRGWIRPVPPGDQCFSPSRVKLHLIVKSNPHKLRIIEDYRRNGLNRRIFLEETLKLPTIEDVVKMTKASVVAARAGAVDVLLGELDIQSAFRMVAVRPSDTRFLRFDVHLRDPEFHLIGQHQRFPFGLRSSPYVFVRTISIILRIIRKALKVRTQ
jgi:hypothetical protein